MFSTVDLVRLEIAIEVDKRFGIAISDEETDGWRTLADIARSVAGLADGVATESEIFEWVRTLIVEGYGDTEAAQLTADSAVFSDYDRATTWFLAAPSPHELADRWFTRNPTLAQARVAPYYCAYNAPSDLTALPPAWRSGTVVSLAQQMSASLDFSALPILADALQAAGCEDVVVLHHCRNPNATHNRGCWVVDLVLGEGRYRAEPGAAPDGAA